MLHIETFGGAPVPSVAQLIFNKTVCLPVSRVPYSSRNVKSITRTGLCQTVKSPRMASFQSFITRRRQVPAQTLQTTFANKESLLLRALSLPFRDLGCDRVCVMFILRRSDLRTHSLCAVRIDQENKHSRRVSATRQGG